MTEHFIKNAPPSLKSAFKDYANETLKNATEGLKESMAKLHMEAIFHYLGLIKHYLEIKFPLSRKQRIELSQICLSLLFDYSIDMSRQIHLMDLLVDLIKRKQLMGNDGLSIPWKPLYDILKRSQFSATGTRTGDALSVVNRHGSKLLWLIDKTRHYFPQSSFKEILDELLPYLNPFDWYYTSAIEMLSVFLPTRQHWVPEELKKYRIPSCAVIDEQKNQTTSPSSSSMPHLILFLLHQALNENLGVQDTPSAIFSLLSRIIKHNPGIANFDPFLPQIFHLFYVQLEQPISGESRAVGFSHRLETGFLQNTHGYKGSETIAKFIVYCMDSRGGDDPVVQQTITLFKTLSNYYYPSEANATKTSYNLAGILSYFTAHYCRRFWREVRGYPRDEMVEQELYANVPNHILKNFKWYGSVDPTHPLYREVPVKYRLKVHDELIDILLPLAKWSIYSKGVMKFSGVLTLSCLSKIWPRKVLEFALPEIYECLAALSQSHRLIIAVEIINAICTTLLNPHTGLELSAQLPQLLDSVLFGIDASLTDQTIQTLGLLYRIFSKVPFLTKLPTKESQDNASDSYDEKDGIDWNEVYNARKEAVASFQTFAVNFIEKILSFIQDITNTNESSQTDKEIRKNAIASRFRQFGFGMVSRTEFKNEAMLEVFQRCMTAFWFTLGPDLFQECSKKVIDVVCNSPQCGELGSILCATMTAANPQQIIPQLLPKIVQKLVETNDNEKTKVADSNSEKKENEKNKIEPYTYNPNGFKLKGSKAVMSYYLGLLENHVLTGHQYLIPYIPLLANIITLTTRVIEWPEIQEFGGHIMKNIAMTLMSDKPSEMRPFSDSIWRKDGEWEHWRVWGMYAEIETKGFQRFWKPNLRLEWFSPTKETAAALQQLINYVLSEPIGKINAFVDSSDEKNDLSSREISEYLRLIYQMCYGCGHLGDFTVDTHSKSLPVIRREQLFVTKDAAPLWWYRLPNDANHPIFGSLIQIRQSLYSPSTHSQDQKVSLRTALTRLAIRLYVKLAQFTASQEELSNESDNKIEQPISKEKKERTVREFPGLNKVLTQLNDLSYLLLNQDGVKWDVISGLNDINVKYQSMFGDYVSGMRSNERAPYITQEHVLTLKRLYFMLSHTTFTTDAEKLMIAMSKTCVGEASAFHNTRNTAIAAITTPRVIGNFRTSVEKVYNYFVEILYDEKADRHSLQAALAFLQTGAIVSNLICATPQRRRHFIKALLQCWRHADSKVQNGVHAVFMAYWRFLSFGMLKLPLEKIQDETYRKEMAKVVENIRREYEIYDQELLTIAKGEAVRTVEKTSKDTNTASSEEKKREENDSKQTKEIDIKIEQIKTKIKEINIKQLSEDIKELIKKPTEINSESINAILKKYDLPISTELLPKILMQFMPLMLAFSKGTMTPEDFQKALSELFTQHLLQEKAKLTSESPNATHWRYQLMASALIWDRIRSDVSPASETVQYFCSLLSEEVPALRTIACHSLELIVGNFVPLLHYRNEIDPSKYPLDHHFIWDTSYSKKITINDLNVPMLQYLLPSVYLSPAAAYSLHQFLLQNMPAIIKAFRFDHPNIVDKEEPLGEKSRLQTIVNHCANTSQWPYDGWNLSSNWFEIRHCRIIRDILRAKWPRSQTDTDLNQWQVSEELWQAVLKAFSDESALTNERESQVTASEIYAGVVRASHHFAALKRSPFKNEKNLTSYLDQKLQQVMLRAIHLCPTESEEAWNSALRYSLFNADELDTEWITKSVLKMAVETLTNRTGGSSIQSKAFISPDKQVRASRYIGEMLLCFAFRGVKQCNYLLNTIIHGTEEKKQSEIDDYTFECFMTQPYKPVREDLAVTFSHIVRCLRLKPEKVLQSFDPIQSSPDFNNFIKCIENKYIALYELQLKENEQISIDSQSNTGQTDDRKEYTKKFDHLIQTLGFWVLHLFNNGQMMYIAPILIRLLPLLLPAQHRRDRFTNSLMQTAVKYISWAPFRSNEISQIVHLLFEDEKRDSRLPPCINSDVWNTRKNVVTFTTTFVALSGNLLQEEECNILLKYIVERGLIDKQVEVRYECKRLLSVLIQSSYLKENIHITALIRQLIPLADIKLSKTQTSNKEDETDLKLRKKHGGILGLSAIVEAFPYTVPEWLPAILSRLCHLDREREPISSTVKKTVSEFKRTHHDEWVSFKKVFTSEQLQDLQDIGGLHPYFS